MAKFVPTIHSDFEMYALLGGFWLLYVLNTTVAKTKATYIAECAYEHIIYKMQTGYNRSNWKVTFYECINVVAGPNTAT